MNTSNCSGSCDSSSFFAHKLHRIGEFLQPFFLLAIRLYFGYLLFIGGSGKIADIAGTTAFFEKLHIAYPNILSYVVGYTEMIGGACLIAGFLSRLVSIPLIIVMLTAIFTAHHAEVFHNSPPFPFLFACLVIFTFGAGQISIDYFINRIFCKK